MNRITFLKNITWSLFLSKTAQSTYIVFTGNVTSAVLAFLYTVILVRNLSLSDIGYFSALWSFLLLVSDVAELGIGTSLSAFVPTFPGKRDRLSVIKTAMAVQFFIAFIVSLPIFLLADSVSQILFHTPNLSFLVRLTSIGIFVAVMNYFYQLAFTAEQRFTSVGIFSIAGSFFRLGLGLLLIFLAIFTLDNAVITQVASLALLFLLGLLLHREAIIQGKILKSFIKKFLTFSSFLGIARGLTALAGRLDVLMIVSIRGPEEAGIYSIASRVISLYPLLAGSFSSVVAPKIASINNKIALISFTKKVIFGTAGILGTIILLIIFAIPFMTILFQEKGKEAAGIFQILLLSMLFFVASIPPVTLAVYNLKKPFILTINSIIQVLVVFIGNLVLIPQFGLYGAGYSLVIAYSTSLVLTTILTVLYFWKKYV